MKSTRNGLTTWIIYFFNFSLLKYNCSYKITLCCFIIHVKIKCVTVTVQRVGREKCNYSKYLTLCMKWYAKTLFYG